MRTAFEALALAGTTVALCGCASTSPLLAARAERPIDAAKIATVESGAKGRNVEVHWINYPLKNEAQTGT